MSDSHDSDRVLELFRGTRSLSLKSIQRSLGLGRSQRMSLRRALKAPIKQIAKNAGLDGPVVCEKVIEGRDQDYGYNALTSEYGDMVEMGVIVPTKVERVALQNAVSIASLLLTTDAVVSEMKEDKSKRHVA